MFFKKHLNIFILLIIFLIVESIINPVGEFCLNDDWAYAASVKTLLSKGVFEIGSWPAMTLYAHVLWGLVFVKLFGFSFTVLRFSILVLSFVTLCITEKLFFRISKNNIYSLVVALLLFFNPLFLSLSNSYMTDISFLCFFLLSIYSFYLFCINEQFKYLIIGFSISLVTIFIRQLGIVIPLGFVLVTFFMSLYEKKWKKTMFISSLFFVAILTVLFLFEKHVAISLDDTAAFQGLFYSKRHLDFNFVNILEKLYVRLGLMMLYTGLALFPILMPKCVDIWLTFKISSKASKVLASIFSILIILVFHYYPCGNYLYNCGLGIETTIDVMDLDKNREQAHFDILFLLIKCVSVLGNILLMMVLFNFPKTINSFKTFLSQNTFLVFCLCTIFFYQILITVSSSFFDRYSLCFFMLCLIIISLKNEHVHRFSKSTVIILVFYAAFSILSIKDYFNYNKAKTELINNLTITKNVIPKNINGGFEYNMWHLYTTNRACNWEDNYKEYVLSFSKMEGYSDINHYSYQRYIPYKIDTIFVLKKNVQ
jgi:hypothetical protein